MKRAFGAVLFVVLTVLWPVAAVGAAAPATVGGPADTVGDRAVDAGEGSTATTGPSDATRGSETGATTAGTAGADEASAGDEAARGDEADAGIGARRPLAVTGTADSRVYREVAEPALVNASTSAEGEPAVGRPTTVTLTMTARRDVSNLTVTLPDYHFVEGDGREFAVGDVSAGATRAVSVTVEPTEAIAKYLRFSMRGTTADGERVQHVSHDLAVVDRWNDTGTLVVDASRPAHGEIPDTTIDPYGNRSAEATSVGTGPDAASGATGSGGTVAGERAGATVAGERAGAAVAGERADATIAGEQVADASSAASGRVSGCFSYSDQNGNLHAGRQLFVRVRDADTDWDDKLATGRTNDNGCFNIRVSDPKKADFGANNIADVYVQIFADNPAAKTTNGALKNRYKVRIPGGSRNLGNGGQITFGAGGRITPSSDDEPFQAVDWALDGRRFFKQEASYTRSEVRIQYPQTKWPSYQPSGGIEHISLPERSDAGWGRSTMHHEYAHAVWDKMYGHSASNKPDKCPNSVFGGCIDGHTIYSETTPGYALVEGWAEFVEAAMVWDESKQWVFYNATGREMHIEGNEWFNISEPSSTNSAGDTMPGADTGDMDGNKHEGSVASIMFDMYDPAGGDGMETSFNDIFETVENNDPQDMRDFLSDWSRGHDEAVATTAFRYGISIGDPYQSNNRFSTAATIGIETVNATVGSGIDYYEVTVPRWTDATVSLKKLYSLSGVDLDLVVYDGSRSRVAASETSSSSESVSLSATGPTADTFYIEVSSSGGAGSYELDLDGSLVDDKYEDNDAVGSAARLPGDGTERRLRLTTDRTDFYEVDLLDQGTLNVSVDRGLQALPAGVDAADMYTVELYDTNGVLVADTSGDTGVPTINYTADEKGTYVVGVSTAGKDTPRSYDLTVSADRPDNDFYEPNDKPSNAAFPTPPARGILVDGEDDWFEWTVQSGSKLNVTIPEIPGERVTFELEDPRGYYVDSTTDGNSIVDPVTDAGIYTIEVETGYENTAEYRLLIAADSTPGVDPPADRFEDNDMLSTATRAGRHLSDGSLSMLDGDNDYYQVTLNKGDRLRVNLSHNASLGTGSLGLSLYGPGQVPLTNAGFGDQRSLTVGQTGTYYVEVYATSTDDFPYALTIDGDDEYEDNDERANAAQYPYTAPPLQSGYYLHEYLNASHVPGEVDWYKVTLDEDERLAASVTPTDFSVTSGLPLAYLNVSVYDGQGNLVAESGPNGGVTVDVTANATYYLRVHPWKNNTYTSDYSLSVSRGDDPANATNADFANASYYVPSDAGRTFELADTSDKDTYAVYLQRGDGLEADLSFAGSADVDIAVYGPDQSIVTQTVTPPTNRLNASADTIATEDGLYYVRVHGSLTGKRYSLSVDRVTDDRFERNDDRFRAPRIGFQTVEGRLFEGTGDRFGDGTEDSEVDLYELQVSNVTALNATLVFDQVGLSNSTVEDGSDLNLAVLDSSGTEIAANVSLTDNATVQASLPSAGSYYLRVNATGIDTVTPYRLVLSEGNFTPVAVGAVERYVDTPRTVTAGSLGAATTDSVTLNAGQNVSYAVQLRAGERLEVTSTADGEVDLALYDAEGRFLAASPEAAGSESLSYVAARNGSFYLEATAASDAGTTLSLSAATSMSGNDRYEANDGFDAATSFSPGAFEDLALDTGDEDYYAVDLRAGQRLTVDARPGDMDGSLELTVFGPERETLASDAGEELASATLTAEREGTYYVRVAGGAETAGTYSLDVGIETPDNDRFEANGAFETAKSLSAGTYDGLRVASGDRDVFAVDLSANEQLYADLRFDQREGNLDLRLYGPEGELVDASSSDTDNESASVEAEVAGTYYVDVRGDRGANGEYDLAVRTEVPAGDDRFEPNGFDRPTPLGTGTYDELRILDGQPDTYAIALPADGRLEATATFDHDDGNVDLIVLGPDDLPVASSGSVTDDESATVRAETGGVYTVTVYTEGNSTAAYGLQLAGDGTEPEGGNETDDGTNETDEGDRTGAPRVEVPDPVTPGGEIRVAVTANETAELLVRDVPANWTVTATDPAELTTVPSPGQTPVTSEGGETWGQLFPSVGTRTFTLTLTAPEETGTYSFTAVAVRNRTETNRTFTVEVAEEVEHESGVSQRTYEVATGEDAELDRADVLEMVRQYVRTQSLEGIPLSRAEVLALVRYYVRS